MDRGLRRRLTARAKQRQERVKSYWPYKCGKYCSYCIGNRTHFDMKHRNRAGALLEEWKSAPDPLPASAPDPLSVEEAWKQIEFDRMADEVELEYIRESLARERICTVCGRDDC